MDVKTFERKFTGLTPLWAAISTGVCHDLTADCIPHGARIFNIGIVPEVIQRLSGKNGTTFHGIVKGVDDALNTYIGMINSKPLDPRKPIKRCNIIMVTVDKDIAGYRFWNAVSDKDYSRVAKIVGDDIAADTGRMMQFLDYVSGNCRELRQDQVNLTYFALHVNGKVMFFPAKWVKWHAESKGLIYRKLIDCVDHLNKQSGRG